MKIIKIYMLPLLLGLSCAGYAQTMDESFSAIQRGDSATAFKGFKKHAESGNANAQGVLGLMYANGQGTPKDYGQAIYWYRKSADQGSAQSQSYLGFMYATGQGVPLDYTQAMYWFRKAADQGDAKGQFNLGNGYFNGQGVPKDYKLAAYWFRKAADQGDAGAQFNLGLRYYNGEGIQKNMELAYFWWIVASKEGLADAIKNRDILEKTLTPQQRANAQTRAREWKPVKETSSLNQGEIDKIVSETGKLSRKEVEQKVSQSEKQNSKMTQTELERLAVALNKTYPKILADGVRIDRVSTGLGLITYHKTLTNHSVHEFDVSPSSRKANHKRFIEDTCSNPGVKNYLTSGISFQTIYRDKNGTMVFDYVAHPSDCV